MKKFILSIDQGTTGSAVHIINQSGKLIASGDTEFKQIYPRPGWVEHDPNDIWKSIESSAQKAFKKAGINKNDILTIGITNQRETVIAWRKSTSEVLHNAIVWQCKRTADMCKKMKPQYGRLVQQKTGLLLDPYFSATKMKWLIEHNSKVKKAFKDKDLAFGTVDTFILWKLTQGRSYFTDVSNASRTLLMNIKTLSWDQKLLDVFGLDTHCLPEIKSSADEFGFTEGVNFLKNGVSINGMAGDQQAALFGQTAFDSGEAKCTFGTGSFILMNTGHRIVRSKKGLLSTVAWKINAEPVAYALEGGAFICGAAVTWLKDGLGLISKSSEIEKLAQSVSTSEGVEFIPALSGLGAPYWNPDAKGLMTGLNRGTTRAHVARATLEALALQNADILQVMSAEARTRLKYIKVDGGASENNLLMQLQADYLQTTVVRPMVVETTGLGAAYLAGIGYGLWKNLKQIRATWKKQAVFKSKMSKKALKDRQRQWQKALAKVNL